MSNNKIYKIIDKVNKVLEEHRIYADVYHTGLPGTVCVEINRGDWKHEHLRAKWLVTEMGGSYISENVTFEDGTDCYSAIHTFRFEV